MSATGALSPFIARPAEQLPDLPPNAGLPDSGVVPPVSLGQVQGMVDTGAARATELGNQSLGDIQKYQAAETGAIEANADVATKVAEAQNKVRQEGLNKVNEITARFAPIHEEARAKADEGLTHYLQGQDELAHTTIYSWYGSAPTGAKILGIISQFLAGASQGLTGTSGPTALDRVIQQDLEVQKLRLQQKSESVQQSGNLYRTLMDRYKDTFVAESAFLANAYQTTAARLEAASGPMATEQIQAKKEEAKAALLGKVAQLNEGVRQHMMTSETEAAFRSANFASEYTKMWADTQRKNAEAQDAAANAPGIKGVPGGEAWLAAYGKRFPRDVGKFPDAWSAVSEIGHTTKEMEDLLLGTKEITDKNGRTKREPDKLSYSDRAAELTALASELVAQIGRSHQLGNLTKGHQQLARDIVGIQSGWGAILEGKTPGRRSPEQIAAHLKTLYEDAKQRARRKIESIPVNGQVIHVPDEAFE